MSTTSHKSRTRILSEVAMKKRVHTSRAERDLTGDGLPQHHNEARVMKAEATKEKSKRRLTAAESAALGKR